MWRIAVIARDGPQDGAVEWAMRFRGGFRRQIEPGESRAHPKTAGRYPNFDLLRLFLAAGVVYEHLCANTFGHTEPFPIAPVPAFLAISGFFMLESLRRSSSIGHFWIKRATRILPAFVASFILVAALAGGSATYRAFLTWVTFGTISSANVPLWSLSCEEVLYGALCLAFVFGAARKQYLPASIVITALSAASIRIATGTLNPAVSLVPCFLLGIAYREFGWKSSRRIPALIALAAALDLVMRNTAQSWLETPFALVSAAAVLEIGQARTLFKLPRDISYGIYIYHAPLIWFAVHRLYLSGTPLWVSASGTVIALALMSSVLIEQPAMSLRAVLCGRRQAVGVEASSRASFGALTGEQESSVPIHGEG